MILDEPTRGIDVGAKAEVRATMDNLAKDGLGVLLISSETEELVGQSHRIFVLKEGRVVGVLTGDDVNEGELVHAIAGEQPAAGTSAGQGEAEGDQHV
jgi:ribose transport system ATP-binding protein